MTLVRKFGGLALLAALTGTADADLRTPARREGLNLNSFVQQGPVAAHVVLRSGADPRLIVAFPAGNSGVGLWFDHLAQDAEWSMPVAPLPVSAKDGQGRALHGVRFSATIHAPRLDLKQAILSSVRVLRDYQALGTAPGEVLTRAKVEGNRFDWVRDRLDGAAGYRLTVTVQRGTVRGTRIEAGADGTITLGFVALTGETPLTPFAPGTLLAPTANADPGARTALTFLSYHEKLNAGSWRFNTYFGRDTLMSVRLMMPALQPQAVETGLRSVLVRLSPDGNVAHEEDIGEFAVLDHVKAGEGKAAAPTYNYNMIDSPFLLAPVARAWLLDDPRGKARAAGFLAQRANGRPLGEALMANIRFVAAQAAAFASAPRWDNLIALKPGMDAGEWRDSNQGLGGGRYPYDVNAVFVPAALEAAEALEHAGLLKAYARPGDRAMLASLRQTASTWRDHAPSLFLQSVDPADARNAIEAYAKAQGVPAAPALAAAGDAPTRYHAIALDGEGKPVPIVNSDEAFGLLFAHPTAQQLDIAAEAIGRPFPAGLMTGAGMLVANPVFADTAQQARFGTNAYHGTVVWSWQQALAAAGLARQLERTDLPAATCRKLVTARDALWRAIEATHGMQSSELWSWRYADGGYRVMPFGAGAGDADESNAAQLWSTVFLALHRPQPGTAGCSRR